MNGKQVELWKVLLLDLMVAALCVGLVAFCRMGLPRLQKQSRSGAAAPVRTVVQTAEPIPTEDPRSPWQIRFEGQFTEETVIGENSYTSPNVAIRIETHSSGEGDKQIVWHVADIYLADPSCLKTWTAHNELQYYDTQDPLEMDREAHAILSISGDFITYQQYGFLVRNGLIYAQDQPYCDLCVLFEDGTMATYAPGEVSVDSLLESGVVQAWNFGPALLDEAGRARDYYEASTAVQYPNPRSAIGFYEPGHYCFIVVDGRQDGYSAGMTLPELGRVFEELGCSCAYNLDGGGSAVMMFLHQRYSTQSNGGDRNLGDLILITEPGWEDET